MNQQWPSGGRRFKRYEARSMGATARMAPRTDAVLRDISIGGASFLVRRPAQGRERCTISLTSDGHTLKIPAQIIWSRNLGEKQKCDDVCVSCYTIGVAFDSSHYDESAEFLAEILRKRLFLLAEEVMSD